MPSNDDHDNAACEAHQMIADLLGWTVDDVQQAGARMRARLTDGVDNELNNEGE